MNIISSLNFVQFTVLLVLMIVSDGGSEEEFAGDTETDITRGEESETE